MLRKAMLCGKWQLPLYVLPETKRAISLESPFYVFVNSMLHDVSCEAESVEWLCTLLPSGKTVVEFFGGIGMCSTIIEQTIAPAHHHIVEMDGNCLNQLQQLFPCQPPNADIHIIAGDSRALMSKMIGADIYFLDFNTFTIWQWKNWPQFDELFAQRPLAVQWTDTAVSRYHLHRERYESILGKAPTAREYTLRLSEWLYKRHGFSIVGEAYHRRGTYYLAKPGNLPFMSKQVSGKTGFCWMD